MLAETCLGRARAARIDPQRCAAQDRGAGRRRSAAAGRGERPGLDFDTALIAAALQLPKKRSRIGSTGCSASMRWCGSSTSARARDRSLTLRYRFAHHLYHSAFYESLRGTRRAALSRAIAERLVQRIGDDVCDCAAPLAVLFETARDYVRAAHYWNRAAQAAARLHAHDETARLARRGLALLVQEPDSPARPGTELDLQLTYGLALKTGRGYAVPGGRRGLRARTRALPAGQGPGRVVPVLIGLAAHHVVAGEITLARRRARDAPAVRAGRRSNLQMMGNWSLGAALFHLGDLRAAHTHLARGARALRPGVPPARASGRPASNRASSAAANIRAR